MSSSFVRESAGVSPPPLWSLCGFMLECVGADPWFVCESPGAAHRCDCGKQIRVMFDQ